MEKKEISETLRQALDDVECIEIQCAAAEINLKDVTAKMVLYLKEGRKGNA